MAGEVVEGEVVEGEAVEAQVEFLHEATPSQPLRPREAIELLKL